PVAASTTRAPTRSAVDRASTPSTAAATPPASGIGAVASMADSTAGTGAGILRTSASGPGPTPNGRTRATAATAATNGSPTAASHARRGPPRATQSLLSA